uniref:Uncharacterized protein n=1 Tax=Anguilla anguilla TaxID=7936 RepID=A0A0E9VUP8_ANGAN
MKNSQPPKKLTHSDLPPTSSQGFLGASVQ